MKKITRDLKVFLSNRNMKNQNNIYKLNNRKKNKKNKEKIEKNRKLIYSKLDPVYYFLSKNKFARKYNYKRYNKEKCVQGRLEIPKNFDLFEHTDKSLSTLRNLFYLGTKSKLSGVHLHHENCEEMCLGCSSILAVIILAIKEKYKIENKPTCIFSGKVTSDTKVDEMLSISGIINLLEEEHNSSNYKSSYHSSKKEHPDVIALRLITPQLNTLITNKDKKYYSDSSNAAVEITNYFNNCLHTQGYELSPIGDTFFNNVVGEIIDNCEEHSSLDDSWFCIGYANVEPNYTCCQLTIFNFGNTIYESIISNSSDKNTPKMLLNVYSKIKKQTTKFTEENIITLLALQDNVSRCLDSENPDRGSGTITLIQEFQDIGSTTCGKNPKMVIISGKTKILFDGKYKTISGKFNNSSREIIAFNDTNNLFDPPDSKYIQNLNNRFPGTIISMQFYLQNDYLKTVTD